MSTYQACQKLLLDNLRTFVMSFGIVESGEDSFVGQQLNLEDDSVDVHLQQLRGWGFNMLRFPVTWEALEHEGP